MAQTRAGYTSVCNNTHMSISEFESLDAVRRNKLE